MIMPIDRHYKTVNRMFSFRFLTTLCLVLMMVANGVSAKDEETALSTNEQQKKVGEIENNRNKSSSSDSGLLG